MSVKPGLKEQEIRKRHHQIEKKQLFVDRLNREYDEKRLAAMFDLLLRQRHKYKYFLQSTKSLMWNSFARIFHQLPVVLSCFFCATCLSMWQSQLEHARSPPLFPLGHCK